MAEQFIAGCETLIRDLFEHYRYELHRWLRRRLRNPADADDVVQEVFTRLCAVERLDFVRKPLSYLFGVAFHVIHEFELRNYDDRMTYDSELVEKLEDTGGQVLPDDMAERLNLQQQIQEALKGFPEHYIEVFECCKVEGMTYEEAARATGVSVHTVEKCMIKIRALLIAKIWDR